MGEFTQFERSFYELGKEDRSVIEGLTGCLFPCTYTEYRVGATLERPWQNFGLHVAFGSMETILRQEVYVYPFISLVSDLGGTLGLFLGFSFFSVMDIVKDILMVGGASIK